MGFRIRRTDQREHLNGAGNARKRVAELVPEHRQELVPAAIGFAELCSGLMPIGDVEAHPDPLSHLAVQVEERDGADIHIPVFSIRRAQPELDVKERLSGDGFAPLLSGPFAVIGVHGMLSGVASQDFAGRLNTGVAVGLIDGFVYLGGALQDQVYGGYGSLLPEKGSAAAKLVSSWQVWPIAMVPVAVIGLALSLRIWNARVGVRPKLPTAVAVTDR